ncbi:tRNA (adenine(58)-N(1))-methyltransferase catalytic subunit TRMT61A-like [Oscarella lobularis]|uniref:tRNA (adenine(58)-N(1))-methyltransferase catalytic subunit TRMT61A-like n=1 Tax=Oscarella lobularis TaxID=121494 RepID=UPI003313E0DC
MSTNFLTPRANIDVGDAVIVYQSRTSVQAIKIERGQHVQTRFGYFPHNDMIGQPYGTKMVSRTKKKGWIYLLYPTPELWTQALPHRTQILYTADISLIVFMLDVRPGSIVIESGTGSGSLSHSIARTLAPTGHLHTFEFHPERCESAKLEFEAHGFSPECISIECRDVCRDGFGLANVADAVFLDLPRPHEAIASARVALKTIGSKIASFSPCIEQVQLTCAELRKNGFVEIETVECLWRTFEVKDVELEKAPIGTEKEETCSITTATPHTTQHGHTGYITFASLYPYVVVAPP